MNYRPAQTVVEHYKLYNSSDYTQLVKMNQVQLNGPAASYGETGGSSRL